MTAPEAEALLGRLTLTGLHCHETRTGVAWTATLCLDGAPVLRVEQAGYGGAAMYSPAKGDDYRAAGVLRTQLEEAAAQLTGQRFEALDALTAAMQPGATGRDGVRVHTSALGGAL